MAGDDAARGEHAPLLKKHLQACDEKGDGRRLETNYVEMLALMATVCIVPPDPSWYVKGILDNKLKVHLGALGAFARELFSASDSKSGDVETPEVPRASIEHVILFVNELQEDSGRLEQALKLFDIPSRVEVWTTAAAGIKGREQHPPPMSPHIRCLHVPIFVHLADGRRAWQGICPRV